MKYNEYTNTTGLRTGDMLLMYRPDTDATENIYAKDVANSLGYMMSGRNASEEMMSNDVWVSYKKGQHSQYRHVNRRLLDDFTRKLQTGTGMITMIHAGAGLTFYQSIDLIDKPFRKAIQAYGHAGQTFFPYTIAHLNSAIATSVTDKNYHFPGYYRINGNGTGMLIRNYFGFNEGHQKTSNFDVYYVEGPLAGGFSVFSGAWNSTLNAPMNIVATVNAVAGTSGCRKLSITGGLDYRQWYISGSGSPSDLRIVNYDMYNTTGRVRKVYYQNNSASVGSITYDNVPIRDNIRNTVFSGYNPDIMIFQFIGTNDDGTYATYGITGLSSFLSGFKKYYPNCPVVVCGTYPVVGAGAGGALATYNENMGQRQAAINYKYPFFDGWTPFNDFPTWSGRGFAFTDGVHHTQSGAYAYSDMLDSWFDVLAG